MAAMRGRREASVIDRTRHLASAPHLQGGAPMETLLTLEGGEEVLSLCGLEGDGPALALGTIVSALGKRRA